jgi:two-component system phosphate regulon sensor histidine kinase PhoR
VLEEALQELDERSERAGVELRLECDPLVELGIRPRMLRVVARNLAENAIRYAGPGTTFSLAVETGSDGSVTLIGRDDGIGVEESELPRLFERFYRADRARASRGTGLGLAIVKHIVTQAGGAVEARGSRGRGLQVRCEFPAPT